MRRFRVYVLLALVATLTGAQDGTTRTAARSQSHAPTHVALDQVRWTGTKWYPEAFRRVYRYKPLIGTGRNDGAAVPQKDVLMGILELDGGATYAAHRHPAPEIYYVLSGQAEWTLGDETFLATPGMAIYTPPNTLHRMVNKGNEKLRIAYFWWAPGGDTKVLSARSEVLEPWPPSEQP